MLLFQIFPGILSSLIPLWCGNCYEQVTVVCQLSKAAAVNKLGKFNAAYLNSKQEIKLNVGNFKFGHTVDKQG